MLAKLKVSTLYYTDVLADENGAPDFLETLAEYCSDPHDVCRKVPKECFNDGYDPLGNKFGSSSLSALYELVEHVQIAAVVKVLFRYEQGIDRIVVSGLMAFHYALAYESCAWAFAMQAHIRRTARLK